MNIEGLWDGTSGLSSLSEKTRESNHLHKKAALSPQLFKDPECWSGRSWTHDLPRDSPVLNQLSHRSAVNNK